MSQASLDLNLDPLATSPVHIAVVQSQYNKPITQGLVDGIQTRLAQLSHKCSCNYFSSYCTWRRGNTCCRR